MVGRWSYQMWHAALNAKGLNHVFLWTNREQQSGFTLPLTMWKITRVREKGKSSLFLAAVVVFLVAVAFSFVSLLLPLQTHLSSRPSLQPQDLSDVRAQSKEADSTLQIDWACSCDYRQVFVFLVTPNLSFLLFTTPVISNSSHLPSCCTDTPKCCTPLALDLWFSEPGGSSLNQGRRRNTTSALSGTEGGDAAHPGHGKAFFITNSIIFLSPTVLNGWEIWSFSIAMVLDHTIPGELLKHQSQQLRTEPDQKF